MLGCICSTSGLYLSGPSSCHTGGKQPLTAFHFLPGAGNLRRANLGLYMLRSAHFRRERLSAFLPSVFLNKFLAISASQQLAACLWHCSGFGALPMYPPNSSENTSSRKDRCSLYYPQTVRSDSRSQSLAFLRLHICALMCCMYSSVKPRR